MIREMVRASELIDILNNELASDPATESCRFEGEIAIACDENGCSWQAPQLRGKPDSAARGKIDALVRQLQEKYCVDEED